MKYYCKDAELKFAYQYFDSYVFTYVNDEDKEELVNMSGCEDYPLEECKAIAEAELVKRICADVTVDWSNI